MIDYDIASNPMAVKPEHNLILCDCDGTIMTLSDGSKQNTDLLELLKRAKELGFEVVIFSNDPVNGQRSLRIIEAKLRIAGLLPEDSKDFFGEVHYKTMFSGKKVFLVFDDDHTTHNVDCENLYAPQDPNIKRIMNYIGFSETLPKRDGRPFN